VIKFNCTWGRGKYLSIFDKSVKKFSGHFPEFEQLSPTPLRAVFGLIENPEVEIIVDLECCAVKCLHSIPLQFKERLVDFCKEFDFKLKVHFED
jgi:hypothetical protein